MPDAVTKSWIRGPADEHAVVEGCRFDEKAAERFRTFCRQFLRHSKGRWAGKPFELLDWQWEELFGPLFGWKRPDGTRRFRRAYIELPKKNGKSCSAAAVGLYLLCWDNEPGAEVYSTATDQQQAGIVHGEAIRMVEASSALMSHLQINQTTKNIAFPKRQSWYRALSGDAPNKEGLNAHGIIGDEIHVWRGRQLWDALKYAGRSRTQPLMFFITTAGDNLQSVCYEQHEYAKGVLSGDIKDSRFFGLIKAADKADDWTDPAIWRKANPSLGLTFSEEDFAADAEEAKKSPTTQASFLRYSLNIWSTGTNPWLKMETWQACGDDFTEDDLLGQECYAGLDLAKKHDTTALVLVFPQDDGTYRLLAYFWLPADTVNDRSKPEEYRVWARERPDGVPYLETTPGNVCDYGFVKKRMIELSDKFAIRTLAFDPWNAEQLTEEFARETGIERVSFGQSMSNFAGPTAEFERLVLSGQIKHPRHPVLNWQAGNVNVRSDTNGNIKPVKPPQGDNRKIDGVVAAIMGLGQAMTHGADVSPSITII